MELKQKVVKCEGEQVPIAKVHEAAKDLEQRYAKVMAWLIDQDGLTDIEFDHNKECIWFTHESRPNTRYQAVAGDWIIICDGRLPQIYDEIGFALWFEKAE